MALPEYSAPPISVVSADTRLPLHQNEPGFDELTKIWNQHGRRTAIFPAGKNLWHSGAASKRNLDDGLALWCTQNKTKSNNYNGFAKADAKRSKRTANLLLLKANHELSLADFDKSSLGEFTSAYCDGNHSRMKSTLRRWCFYHDHDGVISVNGDADEVVVCKPVTKLQISKETPLSLD